MHISQSQLLTDTCQKFVYLLTKGQKGQERGVRALQTGLHEGRIDLQSAMRC